MNGALDQYLNRMNRLLKCPLWCALLSLLVARVALATDPIYQNFSPLYSFVPAVNDGDMPPAIDDRAFDNENVFSVTFDAFTANPEQYETMNTLFYTNNGIMEANSPISTNSWLVYFLSSVGCGFNFDEQVTNYSNQHLMADTFYNPGTIYCDSTNTGNNILIVPGTFLGQPIFIQTSVGIFQVSATNIINPGTVDVGLNGLTQFTGQNADFTQGTIAMEGSLLNQNYTGLGYFGNDTNQDWNPGAALTPLLAYSSWSGYAQSGVFLTPNILVLTNPASYFDVRLNGPSNAVVRAVFLVDTSANMATNVYLQPLNNGLLGTGSADVEWIGSYLNAATGQTVSNYLYLNDDYLLGASTNVVLVNGNGGTASGIPDNFTFTSSSSELLAGPVPSSFLNVFPFGVITNRYSYANAQLLASSVATNASLSNPSGALTNLTGRLQINAKNLDLTLAQISGQNYMSLTATNQFNGSAGALINSPYSDLNLGVTNGFMTVSNLLAAGIPAWSGSVQAWSTRWTNTDAAGFTTDYRVLLVKSQLSPTTAPQVQTLKLHATNSVVISDTLNVFGSIYIDSQNLTLSTNLPGYGATSVDGELNWESSVNLGTGFGQFPNLLWLTNNGAIRSLGFIQFGNAATSYGAVINNGLLSDQGSTIYANNFLSSGNIANGSGSFLLQSKTTTITNGFLDANGDVSITTGSLLTSNLQMQAGRSLTLQVTNFLSDTGPNSNSSCWFVGGTNGIGFKLPIKPTTGDLLGTTITNLAVANKTVGDTWAGLDRGYSNSGYVNNAALGRLVLDPLSTSSKINFSGTGSTSNALYVDCLVLMDQATNLASGNIPEFTFGPNMVIYYAQAFQNGVSVAEKLNFANTNHFRWMPTYVGYYSSTNLVYPPGVTNTVNAALAQSGSYDSDGDGTKNSLDPTPFLVPSQLNFAVTFTNLPPSSVRLQWTTIPLATNYVYYRTNLLVGGWLPFTNFNNYYYLSNNTSLTYPNTTHGNWFPSPQVYNPNQGPDNYQQARVSVYDAVTNTPHYYQIEVNPWLLAP